MRLAAVSGAFARWAAGVTHPPLPQRNGPRATARLREVPLDDRESAYHGSWSGDAILLGLVVAVLLVNAVIIWNQLGPGQEHVRRALFFGVLLVSVFWAAVVYTFKLSVAVRVGPHGLAIVRGPWRTELPWREVSRLVERIQTYRQQRYRWVVALARDGRRLQVREDMVLDYARFRYEVYERYRLWQDHGGTWATAGGGPFMAREVVSGRATWWGVLAALFLLPGLYFAILLPETGLLGPALLAISVACVALAARVLLTRQTYTVDARSLKAAGPLRSMDLAWRDVARVERVRHRFGGALEAGIQAGRLALALAARTDPRVESFAWHPRVPEYLALRGTGRQIRIALHRVARPDELLAWVEFYERVGRRSADQPRRATSGASGRSAREELPANLAAPGGPADPWGEGGALPPPESSVPGAGKAAAWEVSAGGMPSDYDRAPGIGVDPAAQGGVEPHAGDPAWSAPQGYHSGLEGSIDQLWSESRVDHDTAATAGDQSGSFAPAGAYGRASHAMPAREPLPPEPPMREEYGVADEIEAGAEETPTDSGDSPTDVIAPWRKNPRWSPPTLPRYGPAREESPERPDTGSFADDEFLR